VLRFELDGTYDLESAEADAREAGTDPTDEAAMTAYLRHWLTAQAQDALRGIDGARVDDATLAEQPA
jgi:glycosidase